MPKDNPHIYDEAWLIEQYEVNCLTIQEMAKLAGTNNAGIIAALRRFGIRLRSPQESRKLRGTKKATKFPLLRDKTWLRDRYETQNMSIEEIAEELGCSAMRVHQGLREHGIDRRHSARPGMRKSIAQLRDTDWLSREYLEKGRSLSDIAAELGCRTDTVGHAVSRWKLTKVFKLPNDEEMLTAAPRKRTKGGYIEIYTPDHPLSPVSGFVKEHRLVAEIALGRYLTEDEVVHHVNEQRADNRLENLLVFPNNKAHTSFHENPPSWVPRCECCGHPCPEKLNGRPEGIGLLYIRG